MWQFLSALSAFAFGPIGPRDRVRRNTVIVHFQTWFLIIADSLPDGAVQLLVELSNDWVKTKVVLAKKLHADKSLEIDEICKTLRMSRSTFYRYVRL